MMFTKCVRGKKKSDNSFNCRAERFETSFWNVLSLIKIRDKECFKVKQIELIEYKIKFQNFKKSGFLNRNHFGDFLLIVRKQESYIFNYFH